MYQLEIPNLSFENAQTCKRMITKTEVLVKLRKIPSHQKMVGSQKNFMKFFGKTWEDPLATIINKSFDVGELSISQRQAIIKLILKKGKG